MGRRLLRWLGLVPLAGLTVLVLLPVLWMLSTSFQASEKMFQLAMEWIPAVWHPENYPNALHRAPFPLFFTNSLIVSTVVMVGNVVFCTLAGYGLAKFRFPGDRFALLAILSTLMLPLEVTLVPTFLIVHSLGWLNTYQGIFAPLLVDAFGIFLMRQFIQGVPDELIDAARLDGASELRILVVIVAPLVAPALAALALFAFVYHWNSYLWPLTVLRGQEEQYPIVLSLGRLLSYTGAAKNTNLVMAGASLAVIPPLLVFAFLQRYFVRSISRSGFGG